MDENRSHDGHEEGKLVEAVAKMESLGPVPTEGQVMERPVEVIHPDEWTEDDWEEAEQESREETKERIKREYGEEEWARFVAYRDQELKVKRGVVGGQAQAMALMRFQPLSGRKVRYGHWKPAKRSCGRPRTADYRTAMYWVMENLYWQPKRAGQLPAGYPSALALALWLGASKHTWEFTRMFVAEMGPKKPMDEEKEKEEEEERIGDEEVLMMIEEASKKYEEPNV